MNSSWPARLMGTRIFRCLTVSGMAACGDRNHGRGSIWNQFAQLLIPNVLLSQARGVRAVGGAAA